MTERKAGALAGAGAAIAATTQLFVPSYGDGVRWWLNSQGGVEMTVRTLFIAAAVIGASMSWPPWALRQWRSAALFWVGANVGLAFMLFATGPGNLFPIVLGIGGALTLIAIGSGAFVGVGVRAVLFTALRLIPGRSSP